MAKLNVDFHVESQDYFGTLATVLSLVRQRSETLEVNDAVLTNSEHDLLYLQENFLIVSKEKTE